MGRAFRECASSGAPRSTYRPAVSPSRSTHVDSFTGTTSSITRPHGPGNCISDRVPMSRRARRSSGCLYTTDARITIGGGTAQLRAARGALDGEPGVDPPRRGPGRGFWSGGHTKRERRSTGRTRRQPHSARCCLSPASREEAIAETHHGRPRFRGGQGRALEPSRAPPGHDDQSVLG